MKILTLTLLALALLSSSPAGAEQVGSSAIYPKLDALYSHPRDSENGFEMGIGAFFGLEDPDLEFGPHVDFSQLSQNGVGRSSWGLGAEGNLWILNSFGPGLQVDWIVSDHFRIEPLADLRILHLGEQGALALRLGIPYEQSLGWGMAAGITVQLGGADLARFVAQSAAASGTLLSH